MPEYTLDDIKGRHVIDTRGTELGNVEDVVIDPDGWQVRSFLVGLKREVADDLHMERSTFGGARLAISRDRVQSFGDNVLLNVSTNDIAALLREGEGGGPRREGGGEPYRGEEPQRGNEPYRGEGPPGGREAYPSERPPPEEGGYRGR